MADPRSRYRNEIWMPVLLIVLCGGSALSIMCVGLGFSILKLWFFYPSFLFWFFALHRLILPTAEPWDKYIWRACKWWSGIWLFLFALSFCAIPFSLPLLLPLVAIADLGKFHPFLAIILHLLIWACASDILKKLTQPPSTDQLPS